MNWNSFLPDEFTSVNRRTSIREDFQSGRPLPPIGVSGLCPYLRAPPTDPNFQERPEPPRFDPWSRTFYPQLREYVQPRIIPAIYQPMQPPVPDNQPILMASMGHQPMQPPVPDNQPILMASMGQRLVESACYVIYPYLSIVFVYPVIQVSGELHPVLIIPQPPLQQPQPLPQMQPQFQR